jgi:hypothetical protein
MAGAIPAGKRACDYRFSTKNNQCDAGPLRASAVGANANGRSRPSNA